MVEYGPRNSRVSEFMATDIRDQERVCHDGLNMSGQGINRGTGCFPASGDGGLFQNGRGEQEAEGVVYGVAGTRLQINSDMTTIR